MSPEGMWDESDQKTASLPAKTLVTSCRVPVKRVRGQHGQKPNDICLSSLRIAVPKVDGTLP